MTTDEILQKKLHGDFKTAGDMVGITEKNAYAALKREGSKHHEDVKNALARIIQMRETLKKNAKAEANENA
jgi:hypothetical protein